MQDAVAVGECMLEFSARPDGSYALGYAGDTYNAAVYLARSAPDLDVSYVSAVGSDPFSDAMLAMAAHRIDTASIWRHPTRTVGLYLISTDGAGERSFSYYCSEAAAGEAFGREFPTAIADRVSRADLIYLSGISPSVPRPDGRRRLSDVLDRRGCRPWPRSKDSSAGVISRCRRWPTTESCSASRPRMTVPPGTPGVAEIVVKLGEQGCLIRHRDDRQETVPADPVERVVDTTAAGDSFNGRYLAERIAGHDPVSAARRAHRMAGHVIGHSGTIAPAEPVAATEPAGLA